MENKIQVNETSIHDVYVAKKNYLLSVKNATHKQFEYDHKDEKVKCKCGHAAIWWQTGYICGTITAYPCKYN